MMTGKHRKYSVSSPTEIMQNHFEKRRSLETTDRQRALLRISPKLKKLILKPVETKVTSSAKRRAENVLLNAPKRRRSEAKIVKRRFESDELDLSVYSVEDDDKENRQPLPTSASAALKTFNETSKLSTPENKYPLEMSPLMCSTFRDSKTNLARVDVRNSPPTPEFAGTNLNRYSTLNLNLPNSLHLDTVSKVSTESSNRDDSVDLKSAFSQESELETIHLASMLRRDLTRGLFKQTSTAILARKLNSDLLVSQQQSPVRGVLQELPLRNTTFPDTPDRSNSESMRSVADRNIDYTRNMEAFRIRRPKPVFASPALERKPVPEMKPVPLKADHTITAQPRDVSTRMPGIKRSAANISITNYRQEIKRLRLSRSTSRRDMGDSRISSHRDLCGSSMMSDLSRDGSPRPGDCSDRQQPCDVSDAAPVANATPVRRGTRLDRQAELDCKIESVEAEQFISSRLQTDSVSTVPSSGTPEKSEKCNESNACGIYSPPRFLPYGAVDTLSTTSPTRLPRHVSDSAVSKVSSKGMCQQFCSTSALPHQNELPRCSTPEFTREVETREESSHNGHLPCTPKIKQHCRARSQSETRRRSAKRSKRRQSLDTNTTPRIMDSIRSVAKTTFGSIRRAASLTSLTRRSVDGNEKGSNDTPKLSTKNVRRTPSLSSRLRRLSSSGKADRKPSRRSFGGTPTSCFSVGRSSTSPETDTQNDCYRPRNFQSIGKLMAANQDGSQTVLLEQTKQGSLGFFIARDQDTNGIVVSRLSDNYPESFFTGLIAVGDQILEVNNADVANCSVEQVYTMLSSKSMPLIRILPQWTKRNTSVDSNDSL